MSIKRDSNRFHRSDNSNNLRLRPQRIEIVARRERAMQLNRQRREERITRYCCNFRSWSPLGWATESALVLTLVSIFKAAFARNANYESRQNLHLATEQLEERQLLAAVTVGATVDAVNGDTTSIATLITTPGDDGISLREAITAANNTAGADTITFDSNVFTGGTNSLIRLTEGQLTLSDDVTIDGSNGTDVLITGDAGADDVLVSGTLLTDAINNTDTSENSAVFTISGGTANLNNLVVTGGGDSGLNVDSGATLHLSNSILSGNKSSSGGAVLNAGTVTLSDSTLSGNYAEFNGGAVWNSGTITVTDSTISGNTTYSGGAIYSRTNLSGTKKTTIIGSTISGNTADIGGGVYNAKGLTEIRSSTITNNTADGGRGSGIASYGNTITRTEIASSLIAGNTNEDVAILVERTNNSFQSNGFNLIGTGGGALNGLANFNQTGDQTNVVDAGLGPLADNGGPAQTHALLAGSPAINAGDPAAVAGENGIPEFDQRGTGFGRVNGGHIDIGAIETEATSLVVTTNEDVVNTSDQKTSLREAIAFANAQSGSETITFDSTVFTGGDNSLIRLTGGELTLTDDVTIDGSTGTNVTITGDADDDDVTDANNLTDVAASGTELMDDNSRVFNVNTAGTDLALNGLTITGGSAPRFLQGGGVRFASSGNLVLTNSLVSGNTARVGGGVSSSNGSVSVLNSTISKNEGYSGGGGINSRDGTLLIVGSHVNENRNTDGDGGGDGGGIRARETNVIIRQSTVNQNESRFGGGIWVYSAMLEVTNCTISGNIGGFGAGVYLRRADGSIEHSTVTENTATNRGGGIAFRDNPTSEQLTILNSIVAGNTGGGTAPDVQSVGDPVNNLDVNFSLIGDTTRSGITATTGTGNILDEAAGLGPLADNGGPTQTHALLPGSPAIDMAGATLLTNDQRGSQFVRVSGAAADMGAFEIQTLNLVVDTTVDEMDGDYSEGDLSLREAIALANGNPGTDSITFASGAGEAFENGGTIFLAADLNDILITDSLMIDGDLNDDGIPDVTIDADSAAALDDADSRIFLIDDDSDLTTIDVTIDGLIVRDGQTTGFEDGGGIFVGEADRLTLLNSVITGNEGNDGGGIYAQDDSFLSLTNTIVSNNRSRSDGGGIYGGDRSTLLITNSQITGNEGIGSTKGGGVIADNGSTVTISGSTISNNTATRDGGGVHVDDGSILTFINSTISGNVSPDDGGGILHDGAGGPTAGRLTIINSTISGNRAGQGSGVYFESGNDTRNFLTIVNSTIANNHAERRGGGMYLRDTIDATITNSTISGNRAGETGGGFYAKGFEGDTGASIMLANSIVAGNSAGTAGDDLFAPEDTATLTGAGQNILSSAPVGFGEDLGANGIVLGTGNSLTINDVFANIVSIDPDGIAGNGDEFDSGLLADNGGNLETVALKENIANPAVDSGDRNAEIALDETALGVDLNNDGDTDDTLTRISQIAFDSRGEGFDRIVGSLGSEQLPDLGAYEATAPIENRRVSIENGVVTFSGDVIDDEILITETDTDILIVLNGVALWPISKVGITELRVLTKAGEDNVRARMLDDSTIRLLINLGDDNDVARVSGGSTTMILGGSGDDEVTGGNGNDEILGNSGDDNLRGSKGEDTIRGGEGDDLIRGNGGNDILRGNEGDDIIRGGGGNDNVNGNIGNDTLHGNAGDDIIFGGKGDDRIFGHRDNDSLHGGDGSDTIRGGGGDDIVNGNGDNDLLFGGGGDDILLGGSGNDIIQGTLGRNLLIGGLGADNISGLGGDDIFIGSRTTYDNDHAALRSILTIWQQADPAQARIDAIQASATPLTPGTVVIDDLLPDIITAGPGDDWAIVANNDVQVDTPEFLTFL